MSTEQGRSLLNTRTFGAGSVVGVLVGIALITFGNPTLGGVGVLLLVLSAISSLLSVGLYLGTGESSAGK